MHRTAFIRNYPGSFVMSAPSVPPTTAFVFVHGFGGNALTTWAHIQELVDTPTYAKTFEAADLFFYDYESTRHRVPFASDALNSFLTQILEDRSAPYSALYTVGHSLGAVVIRQLMLELVRGAAHSPYAPLLVAASPLLFAPAHFGFRHALAALLIVESIPVLSQLTAIWLLTRGEVYGDVQEGSVVLSELKEQTADFWTTQPVPALQAQLVWGKEEQIVHVLDYKHDVRVALRPGHDHFSVCKPTPTDRAALDAIAAMAKGAPRHAA
jgi:hypothetical protein